MSARPAATGGPPEGEGRPAVAPPPRLQVALRVAVGLVVALTLAGLVLLWPGDPLVDGEAFGLGGEQVQGSVLSVEERECPAPVVELPDAPVSPDDPQAGTTTCRTALVRVEEGPDAGRSTSLELGDGPTGRELSAGDDVVLSMQPGDVPFDVRYTLRDRARGLPLLVLGVVFAAAVVALGRWRGLAALAGLAVSVVLIAGFVVPALLAGRPPLLVALVGGTAVALVVLPLAHGVSWRTTAALLGTFTALALTTALGAVAVPLTALTGAGAEDALVVSALGGVDLRGLLLAGLVIGALGVLDDVTVTQASAVWELRRADPGASSRSVVAAGLRIGRDHVAATVNTLVLAYAGAALPLLVVFSAAGTSLGTALTSEVVAQEVVRTLVGSIGLVAAVPVTTLLAALVAPPLRGAPAAGAPTGGKERPSGSVSRASWRRSDSERTAERDAAQWLDQLRDRRDERGR